MSKAQGQITITDLNDALALTGYIGSNLTKTQMYNPDNDSYNPDWTKTNMILTPTLFAAGSGTDIIASSSVQNVKWYEGTSTTAITNAGNYALSGTKSHILTIKANILAGLAGKDYRCEITYLDSNTNLTIKHVETITLSRAVNGGGITALMVTTPNGNLFKNGEVASLIAKAELWRSSTIDTTNVAYQWYKMDSSVSTDQGGGTGWLKLAETANKYTGVATNTMSIYPDAIDGYAVFKCIAKDTDANSGTYNQTFADSVAFIDQSDPIQVIIQSTGGDVFKNGVGSTVLTAKVYQAGEEIDTAGNGTYAWSKYDKDGNKVTAFSKTGKTLSVGSADVSAKATFIVEVTI